MANLNTSADIINYVLFQAGEPVDGTSDFHAATVEYLNRAYRALWMGGGEFVKEMNEPWLWLKADPPGVLVLNPMVEGDVAVTNNSATATLSVNPGIDLTGRFFRTEGSEDVYRILSHAATTVILDSIYTGDTDSSVSYRAMQLEYDLGVNVLRIVAPMRVQRYPYAEIDGVSLISLDRDYPLMLVEGGVPNQFAPVTERKIRFNRYGGSEAGEFIRVEFDYLQKPADLEDDTIQPLVPLQYRQVLADMTLFYLFSAKSDSRADVTGAQARAGLLAMASDNQARLAQMSRKLGYIYPRGNPLHSQKRILIVGG